MDLSIRTDKWSSTDFAGFRKRKKDSQMIYNLVRTRAIDMRSEQVWTLRNGPEKENWSHPV